MSAEHRHYARVLEMVELQARANSCVDKNWLNQRRDWMLAALVEGAEAIGHLDWKWWSAGDNHKAQVRLELVDVWHFALSKYLQAYRGNAEEAALAIAHQIGRSPDAWLPVSFDDNEIDVRSLDLIGSLKLIIGLASVGRWHMQPFEQAMSLAGMHFNSLYALYVGKNVLNNFRQDHGYKAGTYQKQWNGREDNEVMMEVLDSLGPEVSAERVRAELDRIYAELFPAAQAA
jgi:hypothetical protein